MARIVTPLNATKIINAKPGIKDNVTTNKDYTLSDGQGLQLLVKMNGKKLWEFYYLSPTTKKRRKTSFGLFHQKHNTLAIARDKRSDYLKLIADGIDPIDYYKSEKENIRREEAKEKHTIKNLIDEYYKHREDELSEITIKKDKSRVYYNFIDKLPKKEETNIHTLDFETVKTTLLVLEDEKKLETLKKVKSIVLRILKFAFKRDIVDTSELIGKLELYDFKRRPKKLVKNNPTLTKQSDIKRLYNDLLKYENNLITRFLLIFTIHTAQRQGSIITAKWSDIDFKKKLWVIPVQNMKIKIKDHELPLSDITLRYLKELKELTGSGEYLFPNSQLKKTRNKYPHISNNTVTKSLRILGYTKEQQTAHGFRAMFKTVCKEYQERENLNNEFVERVLAHKVAGEVESAYNRARNIEDMRRIVNWWSEYLEELGK